MNELKDKDLREALRRKETLRTKPEVPADFCDGIMEEIAPKKNRPVIWRWMSAAAAIVLLIGIGTTVMRQEAGVGSEANTYVAQNVEPSQETKAPVVTPAPELQSASAPESQPASMPKTKVTSTPKSTTTPSPKPQQTVVVETPRNGTASMQSRHLHYASIQDSTYQDPARIDEFIAKLADYNEVEAVALDCDNSDSTIVSKAYVFEDSKELDLFARLLQVACWYDSKTPGYLLNFSHQQFFFTLKDLRRGQKYLWMAERIGGGRILLQSTRSTLNVVPSPACYQNYREKLTVPGNINHQNI